MGTFGRATRFALGYRWTFAASIFCALMVGLLWTANIGAIYPLAQAAFEKKSIPDLVEEKSVTLEEEIQACEEEIDAGADEHRAGELRSLIVSKEKSLDQYQRVLPFVKDWTPSGPSKTLVFLCAILIIGTAVKGGFIVAHCMLVARLAQRTTFALRKQFFRRAISFDLSMYGREGAADLMSRCTNDMNALSDGLTVLFGKMVREPLKMIVCLIVAACISWRLLLITLVFAPLAGWLISRLAASMKRANRRAMEEMAQIYGTLEEAMFSVAIIQAFTIEGRQRAKFHSGAKTYLTKAMKVAKYNALANPLTELLGVAMISLAVGAGAHLVLTGTQYMFGVKMCSRVLYWPDLMLFYAMLFGAADPARKLAGLFNGIQRASAASDRVYEVLDRQSAIQDPKDPLPLPSHHEDIVFDDVSYSYVEGEPVLRDINLNIRFGETIALVGPSGCGKSTLTKLIGRFADPTKGEVRIDGVSVRDVRLRVLRRQIGLVTQEPILFNDTIRNNIAMGDLNASEAQIEAAAQTAHAHEFILERSHEGYDAIVGPKGGQLSGGQRQRIALARAVLRDPEILILDEATGNVDMQSEQYIHDALMKVLGHRTTILVTHRPASLALADRIVVMEEGRILAIGSHEELLDSCAFYRDLFQMNGTSA
jgi:ATP-binding cassette, subfamily B, bacterial MsbA